MLGDNVLGALLETAAALASQQRQPLPASDAEGSVYFDVLSSVMVRRLRRRRPPRLQLSPAVFSDVAQVPR